MNPPQRAALATPELPVTAQLGLALVAGAILGIALTLLLMMRAARRRQLEVAAVEARLQASFSDLAGHALRANSDMFLKLARETLGREQTGIQGDLRASSVALAALVDPIRAALEKTEAQVVALEQDRRDAFSTLRTQIESLAAGQSALQRETRNLVTALRRPEVRGRWGELTLRRVVELAGLSGHCDFSEQSTLTGDSGPLRPDLVVHLPEARELVVDAKTPLDAYLEAIDAQDEEQRTQALTRHAQQVEARIRELASKHYWTQFEHSPEFVILFLPGDQFLSSALTERPQLLDNALRQNIIIATPSTLIAMLKAVAYGWRQQAVAENAAQIRTLGQELHRRLGSFLGHLGRTGQRLDGAVEAFNSAVGSLERQVLPGARKFVELGAATGDALTAPEPIERSARTLAAQRAETSVDPDTDA